MRRLVFLMSLGALAVGGCAAAAEAPPAAPSDVVCTDRFCVTPPEGWVIVDQGADHVSFEHPDAAGTMATAGVVNMQGLVEANGGTWPVGTRGVVEVMWSAFDNGNARLGETRPLPDGSIESSGVFGTGRLWHRLVPIDATRAVAVDLRAPSVTWEDHARVFLDGLEPLPS